MRCGPRRAERAFGRRPREECTIASDIGICNNDQTMRARATCTTRAWVAVGGGRSPQGQRHRAQVGSTSLHNNSQPALNNHPRRTNKFQRGATRAATSARLLTNSSCSLVLAAWPALGRLCRPWPTRTLTENQTQPDNHDTAFAKALTMATWQTPKP